MILFAAASLIAAPVPAPNAANCPRTTNYEASQHGKPPVMKKLTELPPAQGYMAVYRRIGGCEAPLTMVDYRNARRR